MRALIVDAEPAGRARLRTLLGDRGDIACIGEAKSVASAVVAIEKMKPELILLGVQLPDGTGFDVFARTEVHAAVVFVTAFDRQTVRAFEASGLDYVLSPVVADRLSLAIDRAVHRSIRAVGELRPTDIVSLPETRGVRFSPIADVAYVLAQDDYTEVVLTDGKAHLCSTTMQAWQDRMPQGFLRVHRSAIVNVALVERITEAGGRTQLHLMGVSRAFPVGRTYMTQVRSQLSVPRS
jgi:two-component system LytT family response regulator